MRRILAVLGIATGVLGGGMAAATTIAPVAQANPWGCGNNWHGQWNNCGNSWNNGWDQRVWKSGPDGRPPVLVEFWKQNWDWCWDWQINDYVLVDRGW